jgi:hypothetical protein
MAIFACEFMLEEGTSALKLCRYLELGREYLELGKGKIRHVLATPKTCGNYAATAIQLPNMRKRRVDLCNINRL